MPGDAEAPLQLQRIMLGLHADHVHGQVKLHGTFEKHMNISTTTFLTGG